MLALWSQGWGEGKVKGRGRVAKGLGKGARREGGMRRMEITRVQSVLAPTGQEKKHERTKARKRKH